MKPRDVEVMLRYSMGELHYPVGQGRETDVPPDTTTEGGDESTEFATSQENVDVSPGSGSEAEMVTPPHSEVGEAEEVAERRSSGSDVYVQGPEMDIQRLPRARVSLEDIIAVLWRTAPIGEKGGERRMSILSGGGGKSGSCE